MLVLEFGIVEFYVQKRLKQYGTLLVLDASGRQTGEEIFFFGRDGQWVGIENGVDGSPDLAFVGRKSSGGYYINAPKSGDKLAFARKDGQRGQLASPWTYANAYHKSADRLKKLLARE